jgi:hypothetical protein
VTSPEPTPTTTSSRAAEPTSPSRPPDAAAAALFDAVTTEHAVIYGYGLVSARQAEDATLEAPDERRRGIRVAGRESRHQRVV